MREFEKETLNYRTFGSSTSVVNLGIYDEREKLPGVDFRGGGSPAAASLLAHNHYFPHTIILLFGLPLLIIVSKQYSDTCDDFLYFQLLHIRPVLFYFQKKKKTDHQNSAKNYQMHVKISEPVSAVSHATNELHIIWNTSKGKLTSFRTQCSPDN